jgi:hypothetical protein
LLDALHGAAPDALRQLPAHLVELRGLLEHLEHSAAHTR